MVQIIFESALRAARIFLKFSFFARKCLKLTEYWRGRGSPKLNALYNYWLSQPEEKILRGAHRGCGDSFFGPKPSQHRENTFNSFEHACAAIEDEKADFIHADLIVTGDKHVICYSNIGLAMYGKKTMVHSQNFHKIKEAAKDGKIKNFEQLDGEVSRSKLRMCGLSDVEKGWDLVEVKDLLENLPEDYGTGTPVNFEIKYAAVMMDNKTEADVAPNYENLNNYREHGKKRQNLEGMKTRICVVFKNHTNSNRFFQ